jgi:hypothetical protein
MDRCRYHQRAHISPSILVVCSRGAYTRLPTRYLSAKFTKSQSPAIFTWPWWLQPQVRTPSNTFEQGTSTHKKTCMGDMSSYGQCAKKIGTIYLFICRYTLYVHMYACVAPYTECVHFLGNFPLQRAPCLCPMHPEVSSILQNLIVILASAKWNRC